MLFIMSTMDDIKGIGEARVARLRAAGVRMTHGLLARGRTPQGRKELAELTGFNEQTILEWVNRADMFRVRGIGSQYSDLLKRTRSTSCRACAGCSDGSRPRRRFPEALNIEHDERSTGICQGTKDRGTLL
jgi:hypothetical protein